MAYNFYNDPPPSPTLTNPDMILPKRGSMSPQRAPLSVETRSARSNYPQYHALTVPAAPPSPSIMLHPSSPLSAIEEGETTPRRSKPGPSALASSPTLRTTGDVAEWPLKETRRFSGLSNGSSSVHSDDLERWKPAARAGDDSLDDGDEKTSRLPKVSELDDEGDHEGWNSRDDDGTDDFLSRRAEIILANAKKRLNLMEGNLKGARHSLTSNGFSNRYSYSSQPRMRQSLMGPSPTTTPVTGHSRAASEASMPSPALSAPPPRLPVLPKRASSALGSFAGGLGAMDITASLRGARSQEVMREHRLKNWILDEGTPPSNFEMPRAASSADHVSLRDSMLRDSPTPSDASRRPASQASDIRAQMNELRHRISDIKERAKESSKRASSLNLRTPSPLSSDNYRVSDPYKSPSATSFAERNYTPDGSPGRPESFSRSVPSHSLAVQHSSEDLGGYAESSHYEDAEETLDDLEEELQRGKGANGHSNGLGIFPHPAQDPLLSDVIEEDMEGESTSGDTEYFDPEAGGVVVAERHEDRADAFDYENFFLHSAMGTYSRDRRDSFSSDSSVETTRPASPLRGSSAEADLSDLAAHNQSRDSISTVATFETAADGGAGFDYLADDTLNDQHHNHPDANRGGASSSRSSSPDLDAEAQELFDSAALPDDDDDDEEEADSMPEPAGAPPLGAAASTPVSPTGGPPPPTRRFSLGPRASMPVIASPPAFPPSPPPADAVRRRRMSGIPSSAATAADGASSDPFLDAPSSSAAAAAAIAAPAAAGSSPDLAGAALMSAFIGLDGLAVSPETIQRDRALVESVVRALRTCCLEMQRARDARRDGWRARLVEARRVLEQLDGASPAAPASAV